MRDYVVEKLKDGIWTTPIRKVPGGDKDPIKFFDSRHMVVEL